MSFEFKMEGLDELEADLRKAVRKCPAYAEQTLKDTANDFKKSAKKRAKKEIKPHENPKPKTKIEKKWGTALVGDNVGMTALVYNSARHFHLVDRGHNLVKNGKTIGFVPGKHIMEKTEREFKDKVPERFEKMIDEILKEENF